MKTVQVEQEFVNALIETFEAAGLEYEVFEGSLLNNFVFTANKQVAGAGRKTKYIVIREVVLNEWTSGYEMILTDSDKKANAFAEEFEAVATEDIEEAEVETIDENSIVSAWYSEVFPTDDLVSEIKSGTVFKDVFEALDNYSPVHELIGDDSIVRERIFEKLAEIMNTDYDYIYEQWLKASETEPFPFIDKQFKAIMKFQSDAFTKLEGVYFTPDTAIVADGFRAIFINGNYATLAGKTYDINKEELNNVYPVKSMLRTKGITATPALNQYHIKVDEMLKVHKEMLPLAKEDKNNTVVMNVGEEVVYFNAYKNKQKFSLDTVDFTSYKHESISKGYNCKFMIEALQVLKVFGYKEALVKYNGHLKPIGIMSYDEKVTIMLMPVRL